MIFVVEFWYIFVSFESKFQMLLLLEELPCFNSSGLDHWIQVCAINSHSTFVRSISAWISFKCVGSATALFIHCLIEVQFAYIWCKISLKNQHFISFSMSFHFEAMILNIESFMQQHFFFGLWQFEPTLYPFCSWWYGRSKNKVGQVKRCRCCSGPVTTTTKYRTTSTARPEQVWQEWPCQCTEHG